MLEGATTYEPRVVNGRFMIHARHQQHPGIVIVEPDVDAKLLVVWSTNSKFLTQYHLQTHPNQ